MNEQEIKVIIEQELLELCPEADLNELDIEEDLRDELDIDSMDFMRLTIALGKRLGIQIPDTDHAKIVTFESMLSYLKNKVYSNK